MRLKEILLLSQAVIIWLAIFDELVQATCQTRLGEVDTVVPEICRGLKYVRNALVL